MKKDESVIPKGLYCYTRVEEDASLISGFSIKHCPYWSSQPDQPIQESGFCSFLNRGDWQSEGISLLWDQVKECNVNLGDFND